MPERVHLERGIQAKDHVLHVGLVLVDNGRRTGVNNTTRPRAIIVQRVVHRPPCRVELRQELDAGVDLLCRNRNGLARVNRSILCAPVEDVLSHASATQERVPHACTTELRLEGGAHEYIIEQHADPYSL